MMAASKPTSWLFMQLHILQSTQSELGTLAGGLGCFPFDYGAYPPQSDSHDFTAGIRSLNGVSTLVRAIIQSVLYLRLLPREASPKAISRRTSYHRV